MIGLESMHGYLRIVVLVLEMAGVGVILAGVAASGAVFLRDMRGDFEQAYEQLRTNLGRGILLGLELLVGADIIATVSSPLTVESVGLLAGIVLIRTFLSFSLETEIRGRPPWRGAEDPHHRSR